MASWQLALRKAERPPAHEPARLTPDQQCAEMKSPAAAIQPEKKEISKMRTTLVLALMTLSTALFSIRAAEPIEHTQVPLATVKHEVQSKKALLVDVREKREWDKGHIAGAVLLPLSDIQQGIDPDKLARLLPKDKIIYAHCARGGRCLTAADLLKKNGYQIRPLKPGYKDLIEAGFEKAKR
jgi:phage shock protein E